MSNAFLHLLSMFVLASSAVPIGKLSLNWNGDDVISSNSIRPRSTFVPSESKGENLLLGDAQPSLYKRASFLPHFTSVFKRNLDLSKDLDTPFPGNGMVGMAPYFPSFPTPTNLISDKWFDGPDPALQAPRPNKVLTLDAIMPKSVSLPEENSGLSAPIQLSPELKKMCSASRVSGSVNSNGNRNGGSLFNLLCRMESSFYRYLSLGSPLSPSPFDFPKGYVGSAPRPSYGPPPSFPSSSPLSPKLLCPRDTIGCKVDKQK